MLPNESEWLVAPESGVTHCEPAINRLSVTVVKQKNKIASRDLWRTVGVFNNIQFKVHRQTLAAFSSLKRHITLELKTL